MSPVDVLNGWGAVWSAFMLRALIDASALLVVLLLIWLPFRKRISAQLGHGLFLLVLVKLIIPTPLPSFPLVAARQATVWVWDLSVEVIAEPPLPLADRAVEPLVLPTTGDLTAGPVNPRARPGAGAANGNNRRVGRNSGSARDQADGGRAAGLVVVGGAHDRMGLSGDLDARPIRANARVDPTFDRSRAEPLKPGVAAGRRRALLSIWPA